MNDDIDIKLVKFTQDGIPLTLTPYQDIGEALGLTEEEVIERLTRMLSAGSVKRLGASIAHRKIGITSNAMCAWKVPSDRVEEVGGIMAGFHEVTHCYERPTLPDWPYNVYTMIHGYSDDECEEVIERMKQATGVEDYVIMYSEEEFKKDGAKI